MLKIIAVLLIVGGLAFIVYGIIRILVTGRL
jgi:hypothetical protein